MWNSPPKVTRLSNDLTEAELQQFWVESDRILNDAHVYKHCKARWVGRVDLPNQSIIMKVYRERSIRHQAKQSVRKSRALSNGQHALRMLDLGLTTPFPLATLEERWGPFRGKSCLLLKYVSGAMLSQADELLRLMVANYPSRNPIDAAIEQLRDVRCRLLELKLHHHDVHSDNFLFDDTGKMQLLDIESIRPAWSRRRSAQVLNAKFDTMEAVVSRGLARVVLATSRDSNAA